MTLNSSTNFWKFTIRSTWGEFLNQVSPGQWCRETINRWVKGKASPRLSHRDFEALKELSPKPPLNHPNYDFDFDFVDLFAGIGRAAGFAKMRGRVALEP